MATDRQKQLLAAEDWRHFAADAVGTGLGFLATTENHSGNLVSFSLPSAPALYLNLAKSAHQRRSTIDLDATFVKHPRPQGTWPENHGPLFDYFESFAAEVIFSFTALEAFANEVIPPDFVYMFKPSKKADPVPLSKPEIERKLSLDEKLKVVLPQAHKIKSPAGTKPWQQYKQLKQIRDRLVHIKSIDRKSSGPEHQTLWGVMLENGALAFPDIAARVIGHYKPLVKDRRWFGLYVPITR